MVVMAQVNHGTRTYVQIHTMHMLSQPGPFACQRSWGLIFSREMSNLLATVCPEVRHYVPLGNQGLGQSLVLGSPAATVTQRIGFQGFLSVALDAIQPPLSLRVLSSGHSSSSLTAQEVSPVPDGWA